MGLRFCEAHHGISKADKGAPFGWEDPVFLSRPCWGQAASAEGHGDVHVLISIPMTIASRQAAELVGRQRKTMTGGFTP